MKISPQRTHGVSGLAVVLLAALSGCGTEPPLAAQRIQIALPSQWQANEPSHPLWPGEHLASYKTEDANLSFYRTLRVPGAKPENLSRDLVTRLEHLPSIELVTEKSARIGGQDASVVEATAPGDGFSWAPSGLGQPVEQDGTPLVTTHRLSFAIPRDSDTIWVVSYFRDPARARPSIEQALSGLTVQAQPLRSSTY